MPDDAGRRLVAGTHEPFDLVPVLGQRAREPRADESPDARDEDAHYFFSRRSRSASTIISTSCAKRHLRLSSRARRCALAASPTSRSTSAGRKNVGSMLHVLLPVEPDVAEGELDELAHGVRLAGGDDVVVGLVLLEHQPHGLDVVAGEAPVALGVEVAEAQLAWRGRA